MSPSKNQYAYKLEGFDLDWIYNGNRRIASYTNLDPGNYTFRVRGSNNDGVWNEKGLSLPIVIIPPWWGTLGFRIMSVVLAFLIIIGFYFIRTYSMRKRNRDLALLVDARTVDLKKHREAVVNNPTAIFITDKLGNIEYVNRKLVVYKKRMLFCIFSCTNSVRQFILSAWLLKLLIVGTVEVKISLNLARRPTINSATAAMIVVNKAAKTPQ